VVRLF